MTFCRGFRIIFASTFKLLASKEDPLVVRCTPSGRSKHSFIDPFLALKLSSLSINSMFLSLHSLESPALNASIRLCICSFARGHTLLIFTNPLPLSDFQLLTTMSKIINTGISSLYLA